MAARLNYSPEEREAIVTAVCRHITGASGVGKLMRIREACSAEGVDYATLQDWLMDSEALLSRYSRARSLSATAWEDRASEAADNATPETVQVAALQGSTARWRASVANPRTHGSKVDVTSDNEKLSAVVILPAIREEK